MDAQGNVIDEIYPFNNIDDLVSAVFYPGQARATDLSDHNHVLLELKPNQCMRTLVQDIGKQGFDANHELDF